MKLEKLPDKAQADTETAGPALVAALKLVKPVEDSVQFVRLHSESVVLDTDPYFLGFSQRSYMNKAAIGGVFNCVIDQVDDHLVDSHWIAIDGPGGWVEV